MTNLQYFFFLCLFFYPGEAFFPQLFNFGARTSNCFPWSLWSPCFSTAEFQFNQFRVPGECYYLANSDYILNYNGPLLENIYDYYKRLNMSTNACGQCIFQISCSRNCAVPNPNFFPSGTGANVQGISEQLCDGFDQSDACAMNSDEAYNPKTGECQIWPPLHRDIFASGFVISSELKNVLYSMRPNNCISVDKKCFCCCAPYKPDPCTAKCLITPCSSTTVFTAATLPSNANTRRRRHLLFVN